MMGPVTKGIPSNSLPSSDEGKDDSRSVKMSSPSINKYNVFNGRSGVDPSIVMAAEGMEAMFLDYMLKVMRQTVPRNEMDLESPATGIYRSMLDSEYAQKAVKSGSIGLAEQIIAYLTSKRYTLSQGNGASQRAGIDEGANHEGQSVDK